MAGKTGTAWQPCDVGYECLNEREELIGRHHTATFAGIVSNDDGPALVVLVVIDQPKGDRISGGRLAAPAVSTIAEYALRQLRIPAELDAGPGERRRAEPATVPPTTTEAHPETGRRRRCGRPRRGPDMISLGELARALGADVVAPDGPNRPEDSASVASPQVRDVEHDSRLVVPGALFACIPGAIDDGHRFAGEAVSAGAVGAARGAPRGCGACPAWWWESVRRAVGPAAAEVHGHPGRRLDLAGVTGTNGKTTTVRLVAGLLRAAGRDAAEIGTLTGALTTPEATDLQRALAQTLRRGASAAVVEVSSHGLVQHRVDGCRFRVAAFTNLGHDHLDYHGNHGGLFLGQGTAVHDRPRRDGGCGRHQRLGTPPRGGGPRPRCP